MQRRGTLRAGEVRGEGEGGLVWLGAVGVAKENIDRCWWRCCVGAIDLESEARK
jgi:hypothetical protein